ESETVSRLELSLVALAQAGHFGHVHAMDGGDVGRSALGHHHVFGDLHAHGAHRLDARLGLTGGRQRDGGGLHSGGRGSGQRGWWRGGGLRLCRGVGLHVLFGNPAAGAGALHLRQIEIKLTRHLADQRRERTGGLFLNGRGTLWVRRRRSFHRLGRWRSGRRFGRGGSGRRWRRFGGRSGGLDRRHGGAAPLIDARDYRVDADRLAFLHQDFGERAGGGGGNLGVHLVGGDLKERLVALDALAGLFEPLGQRAFHNAFAHLGHDDVGHISSPASRNRKSGRSGRRVLRPPRRGLHGRRARPSRSPAGSIRRERCIENSSNRWTR